MCVGSLLLHRLSLVVVSRLLSRCSVQASQCTAFSCRGALILRHAGFSSCSSRALEHRRWHPTPVLLPGKSHGRRSLVGCSPWGHSESDTTERLHFHFSLSCIGEGNGNPLQCSCLENPRVGGAWWAAIYGVAQSRTRVKQLSSSSSSKFNSVWFSHSVMSNSLRPH